MNLNNYNLYSKISIMDTSSHHLQFHVVMTQKCNLNCSYCGSTVDPEIMPVNLEYKIVDLQKFFSQMDQDPTIAFYGGEPAINADKICEIMDYIPARAFMLQTNGTLLHRIPTSYYSRFHSILISVDGRPETTNFKRGDQVHQRAIRGAKRLQEHGFEGDLIARMTVTRDSDIFEDVIYLLELENPQFNHVHWQLDVLWGTEYSDEKDEIKQWLKSYNAGITRLIDYWIDQIERTESIPGIVPFLGIVHTFLNDQEVGLRCGAGSDFFSITTDGRVTICPILPSVSFAVVGSIFNNTPDSLRDKIQLEEPCTSCDVRSICGGRCIYTNKTQFWGDEGFDLVCNTVKHLINQLEKTIPRIEDLIRHEIISRDDFDYPKIPNGVEIIP